MIDKSILDRVEIPDFGSYTDPVEMALAFIEYVKQIERERGLTEEEIDAKYLCGSCEILADGIVNLLKLYGKNAMKYPMEVDYLDKDGSIQHNGKHVVVDIFEKVENNSQTPEKRRPGTINLKYKIKHFGFVDILGPHTAEDLTIIKRQFYLSDKYRKIVENLPQEDRDEDIPLIAFYNLENHLGEINASMKM